MGHLCGVDDIGLTRVLRVQQLKFILTKAGLVTFGDLQPNLGFSHTPLTLSDVSNNIVTASTLSNAVRPPPPTLPVIPPLDPPLDATPVTIDDTPIPTFDMFFNLDEDMDGEHDGDFLPTSSPKHDSSGESDFEEAIPTPSTSRKRKGKRKARFDEEEEEDDDFVDPEVEDENLFLPIEDVPIPEDLKQDAMRSLGVDNQAQLVNLINKMVHAGQEGMTPETVEKLKVLLTLVGPQGNGRGRRGI